jgi:hypothetical protein
MGSLPTLTHLSLQASRFRILEAAGVLLTCLCLSFWNHPASKVQILIVLLKLVTLACVVL